jgi:hypothetical protein
MRKDEGKVSHEPTDWDSWQIFEGRQKLKSLAFSQEATEDDHYLKAAASGG